MRLNFLRHLVHLSVLLLLLYPAAFAEMIKKVDRAGILTLADGKQVHLAGIELSEEGPELIALILSGKEAEIETESASASNSLTDEIIPAYVYVDAESIPFPFDPAGQRNVSRVMVNELLLQLGAATLDAADTGSHHDAFARIEDEAKRKGHGVWSYEPFHKSKKAGGVPADKPSSKT
jgi:endonuclease YncB( thermonuclease family)